MNSIKKAVKTKTGKAIMIGGIAFTLFTGGVVSASVALVMFDQEKATKVMENIDYIGGKLMEEKQAKYYYKDKSAERQQTIRDKQSQISNLQTQISTLEQSEQDKTAQISDLQAQISQLQAEIDGAVSASEIEQSQAQVSQANAELEDQRMRSQSYKVLYNDGKRTNATISNFTGHEDLHEKWGLLENGDTLPDSTTAK